MPSGSPVGAARRRLAPDLSEASTRHPPLEGHAAPPTPSLRPVGQATSRTSASTGDRARSNSSAYVVVQDVGRALNPALVEGQMRGAAVQSIGRALTRRWSTTTQGQLITGTFLDYAVPRAACCPPIETHIVEVPAPEGPFGAKGIGEAAMPARPGGDRQRDRGGPGPRCGAPDDGEADLGGVPIRRGRVTTGAR